MKMLWPGLCLLLFVLAACGGGGELKPPATLPPGYTLSTGLGVSLALPPGWYEVPVTTEDFAAVADQLRAENPDMAAHVDSMAAAIEDDTLRFAAYSADGRARVNISAQAVAPFSSLRSRAAATRQGLEDFGYQILEHGETTVNGVEAQRTLARLTLNTATGQQQIMLLQYTLISGGLSYSISFGVPAADFPAAQAAFEKVAQTFHTVKS